MSINIQKSPEAENNVGSRNAAIVGVLALMLAGRAMTLAFLPGVGSGVIGAAPGPWLMPLVGDAVVGLSALGVAYLAFRGRGLGAWTAVIVWNAIGIWDALSAYLVHLSTPWPEFFMIQIFGPSMFFAASAMHIAGLVIASRPATRARFGLE